MRTKSFAFATIFVTAFAIIAVLVSGCSKEEQQGNFTPNEELSVEEKNANLELLGQAFGSALAASPELRGLVWAEAQKQVTHDYDVPFLLIKDMDVGGISVAHLVEAKLKAIAPKVDLGTLVNSLHYVQLTIPLHQVQGWDAAVVPSVAVYPIGVGQKELVELVGFSPGGQRTAFCAREEPTEPVVVVRESDRIDRQGRLSVNRHGLGLGEIARVCIREVSSHREAMLKSGNMVDEEPLIHIISEDSLARLRSAHEVEQLAIKTEEALLMERFEVEHGNRLKSTQNMITNSLSGTTNQPRAIFLNWTHAGGSGVTYKVFASGMFRAAGIGGLLGQSEHQNKRLMITTTSLNASVDFPFNFQVYNVWVEGERNGQVISTSNSLSTRTSPRADGSIEFPIKISMTASVMRDMEGWAANDLEIYFVISQANNAGNPVRVQSSDNFSEINGGFIYHPHYSWGLMQNTDRTYSHISLPLFNWNKYAVQSPTFTQNARNGAYTIFWYEDDRGKGSIPIRIATRVVVYTSVTLMGGNVLLAEGISSIADLIFNVDDDDDTIGFSGIDWWTAHGSRTFPLAGVVIEHGFQNP